MMLPTRHFRISNWRLHNGRVLLIHEIKRRWKRRQRNDKLSATCNPHSRYPPTIMTILTQTREIIVKATSHPPDLGPIQPYHLSDPTNPQSDLCFPTILLYPLSSQTNLIAEFPLSSTLHDQLSIVLEESPAWDTKHEYKVDNVECYMEIQKEKGLGLIKIG